MKAAIQAEQTSLEAKSLVANIVRYVPSGAHFARLRVGGKLIRRSPTPNRLTVAQMRWGDVAKEERGNNTGLRS